LLLIPVYEPSSVGYADAIPLYFAGTDAGVRGEGTGGIPEAEERAVVSEIRLMEQAVWITLLIVLIVYVVKQMMKRD
jgi:hypothetical protein